MVMERLQAALVSTYRIERELGGGGMSRVFVATELALDRPVVLKVLPPELAQAVSIERFHQEIRLAARLQHPHIVALLSAGDADGLLYYTMPYIEGESLRVRIARGGELPVREALRVLRDIAAALAYAHEHGVVHRDIKPDNVLLSGGEALVTDFGVAKALSASAPAGGSGLTTLGVALGTPAYMAPEQAAADPQIDHRADLYAWGCVAYEVLTGQPPFVGRPAAALLAAHATESPEAIDRRRPALPAALSSLVMRCLEKRPADRPQSASEILQALEAVLTPSAGMTPTVPVRVSRRRRRPLLAAIGGGAMAIIAGLGVVLSARPTSPGADALDERLVAVLPFRVAGAEASLGYLREGVVDLLAAKLTGAGGLRAVDPRTALSAWRRAGGTSDHELAAPDALELSRELGAGRLLDGSVVGSRGRLTLSASLLTVPRGAPVAQATAEGSEDSLAVLLDRLTAKLLTAEAGGASTATSALSTSLPALQAYLDGVAEYRRGRYVDAGRAFDRALDFDSTFTDAAFMLRETWSWEDVPGVERADRIVRGRQDRLSPRNRALLLASDGPRFPGASSGAELITAAERGVAAYPDQPGAWYHLGDWYFHLGDALGIPDAPARALAAFARAMSLDPDFSGPREHLIELRAAQRDTAALQALERQLGGDETHEGRRPYLLWRITAAIGDSAARANRRATLDSLQPRELNIALRLVNHDALDQADADTLLAVMERRATTRDTRINAAINAIATNLARGRPGAALQAKAREAREGVNQDFVDRAAVFHALYADGDTLDAARAVERLISKAEAAPATQAGDRAGQYAAACWVEQWRLAHGESRTGAPSGRPIARGGRAFGLDHHRGRSTPVRGHSRRLDSDVGATAGCGPSAARARFDDAYGARGVAALRGGAAGEPGARPPVRCDR